MKIVLVIIIVFFDLLGFSQTSKIASNISKIENGQFIILHDKPANFSMKSPAAHKLIKIGKSTTDQLIVALNDSTKVIMAHLVLCHIWFKHVSFAGPKILATNNGDVAKYYLGEEKGEGLIISEIKNTNGTYRKYIETSDIEKIKKYWSKKVAGKLPASK